MRVKKPQSKVTYSVMIRSLADRMRVPARRRNSATVRVTVLLLVIIALGLTACSIDQAASTPASSHSSASLPPNAARDYNRGLALQSNGRCDRAIPLYLKAVQENSVFVNAYRSLGDCYHSQGSDNAAIIEYNEAIQIDPTNWYLYYSRAAAEVSLGMTGQGQADYNNALRLAPPVRDTYVSIAQNGFNSFNDFADAVKAMGKAIDLSPNDPSLYEARGNIYLTAKQYTDAYNDYKKAIAVAPFKAAQASINADLANVYAGQANYDAAFGYMRTAISLQPNNPGYYVQSGNIHRDAGHNSDAIGLYQKAISRVTRVDKTDAEAAHEGIGDVLANEGKPSDAVAAYQQAMRFTKDTAGLNAKIKAQQQAEQQ